MKACVIQPAYSVDFSLSDKYFEAFLELLDKCDASMDIIVCPEACDVPCLAKSSDEFVISLEKFSDRLHKAAADTAKRCNAMVFVAGYDKTDGKIRNTTFAYNRKGELAGKYFKQHLTPTEPQRLDSDYSFMFSEPTVIEIEGIRFGFLTCYDFYFYENFGNLARYNLDIIIGCSHQRSDSHHALEIITEFLAYNTNTYILRASVSMDKNSDIGGASMIVSPKGEILCNMKSRVGLGIAEFDVSSKYYKPAGFGNPDAPHYEYIEKGRRPYKYRPAGSAICQNDDIMSYPRICAHRGFNTVAPENSMAAFGAAVAMGADEIEFDLWTTKDGEIVTLHDATLDRISTGSGKVYEKNYSELLSYDFGVKHSEEFKGLKILTFEEILEKFSCHTIMNIHLKTINNSVLYDEASLLKIIALIKKYDCEKYVYFMTGNDNVQKQLMVLAPHIARAQGAGDEPEKIIERAIENKCKKVQLFKPYINEEMIKTAHENGIRCNVFWSDDEVEAKQFIEMGIDTILTNDYNRIANAIKK